MVIFFIQEGSVLVHCACSTVQLLQCSRLIQHLSANMIFVFPGLPGSAEAQLIWGVIVKHLLIVYFIGNISAKKYQNPFILCQSYSKPNEGRFWDMVYIQLSYGCQFITQSHPIPNSSIFHTDTPAVTVAKCSPRLRGKKPQVDIWPQKSS